jgi:hypothetical protein
MLKIVQLLRSWFDGVGVARHEHGCHGQFERSDFFLGLFYLAAKKQAVVGTR